MKLTKDVKIIIGVVAVVVIVILALKLAHNQENETSVTPPIPEEDIICNLNAQTYEDCMKCKTGVWCPQQKQCRQFKKDQNQNIVTCS